MNSIQPVRLLATILTILYTTWKEWTSLRFDRYLWVSELAIISQREIPHQISRWKNTPLSDGIIGIPLFPTEYTCLRIYIYDYVMIYFIVLSYIRLHYIKLKLYYIILYWIISYYVILSFEICYYIILYQIILYYIILC